MSDSWLSITLWLKAKLKESTLHRCSWPADLHIWLLTQNKLFREGMDFSSLYIFKPLSGFTWNISFSLTSYLLYQTQVGRKQKTRQPLLRNAEIQTTWFVIFRSNSSFWPQITNLSYDEGKSIERINERSAQGHIKGYATKILKLWDTNRLTRC